MQQAYTRTAIALHWLIALSLIGTFALGLYMQDLTLSPTKLKLYSWHKWAGISLLLAVILRLGWRLMHPAPALPSGMSKLAQRVARAGHALLYILMLAVPISGWLMSSAQGVPIVWFGVIPLPDLVARDPALGEQLTNVHFALNIALAIAVVGHLAAALVHHFIKKDGVLVRMLPLLGHHDAGPTSART